MPTAWGFAEFSQKEKQWVGYSACGLDYGLIYAESPIVQGNFVGYVWCLYYKSIFLYNKL